MFSSFQSSLADFKMYKLQRKISILIFILISIPCLVFLLAKFVRRPPDGADPVPHKLKFAVDKLEAMVEKGLPSSGLTLTDVWAAYNERLTYKVWRKLMTQRVLDLFFDLIQFIESDKVSLIDAKYKPTNIEEFELWYKKLRPFYYQAAVFEMEQMMKDIREQAEEDRKLSERNGLLLEQGS